MLIFTVAHHQNSMCGLFPVIMHALFLPWPTPWSVLLTIISPSRLLNERHRRFLLIYSLIIVPDTSLCIESDDKWTIGMDLVHHLFVVTCPIVPTDIMVVGCTSLSGSIFFAGDITLADVTHFTG